MIKNIGKNKSLYLGYFKSNRFKTIFSFDTAWTVRCDHAGFRLSIQIYKFNFELELTDNRHWDIFNKRFEEHV